MAFFDNFREKAKDLAQAGVAKSKQLADIAKLKTDSMAEEDAIKKAYIEIGKLYYAERGASPEGAYVASCEKITASKANIEANNAKIAALRAEGNVTEADEAAAEPDEAAAESAETAAEPAAEPAEPAAPETEIPTEDKPQE